MFRRCYQASVACILSIFCFGVEAIEFRGEGYEVYIGDVNGDGINDAYLKVPDTFVLIHGDISIPLLIDSAVPSYVIASVDVSSPYYLEPVIDEGIDESLLVKASEDATLVDLSGDGVLDLQISSPLLLYAFAISGTLDQFLATSPAPAIDPDYFSDLPDPQAFVQPAHDAEVGALGGTHSVSPDGVANYSIPIEVTGGRQGVQPNLAISYSSNSGNGALGIGWTLNGLSAILRCPNSMIRGESVDPVDFENDDKFCLDGERLVLDSGIYGQAGATYRKAHDDGTHITSFGAAGSGPLYFKVWTPDSLVHYYGSEIDSRVKANGRSEIATWALNRTEDRYSNYLTIAYSQPIGSGSFRPDRIDYTGNTNAAQSPQNSVRFIYSEGRSDSQKHYISGSFAKLDWLMERVEVYSSETKLREYSLDYDEIASAPHYKRLISIKKCAGTSCLPATVITWSEEKFGHDGQEYRIPVTMDGHKTYADNPKDERFIDLNNDGLVDRLWRSADRGTYFALENTGDGFSWFNNWEWIDSLVFLDGDSIKTETVSREWYLDMDGDGYPDRIWEPSDSNDNLYWIRNTGAGFDDVRLLMETTIITDLGVSINTRTSDGREAFADFNNDALPDRIWRPASGTRGYYVALNNGSGGFSVPKLWLTDSIATSTGSVRAYSYKGRHEYYLDMNGDGLTDRFWKPEGNGDYYVALNSGNNSFLTPSLWLNNTVQLESWEGSLESVVDLNGDGLPDFVWNPTGAIPDYYVAINTGKGFNNPEVWLEGGAGGVNATSYQGKYEQYIDLTGDGLPDRVWLPDGGEERYFIAVNTGRSFSTPVVWLEPLGPSDVLYSKDGRREQFVDINGDGYPDRIWNQDVQGGVAGGNHLVAITKPNYRKVEKIVVGNGDASDGHATSFYYASGLDKDVHQHNPNLVYRYPFNRDNSARALVKKVTTSNGLDDGGGFSTVYTYFDGKRHLLDHFALGFAKMKTESLISGIETITTYDQGEPVSQPANSVYDESSFSKTNRTVKNIQTWFQGRIISETNNTWRNVSTGSGAKQRDRLELGRTTIYKRDLGGQFLSYETNDYTYNDFGSPKTISTELLSSGVLMRTKFTEHEYTLSNDSHKLLPAIAKTIVEITAVGKPTQELVSSWQYDETTGRKLKERVLDPADDSHVIQETEYENIDVFGNHRSVTVRGADFQERTTSVTYDLTGRYIVTSTNELKQVSSTSYYPSDSINAGMLDVNTDINGLRTKYYYDVFSRLIRSTKGYGTSQPVDSYSSYQWCSNIVDSEDCESHMSGAYPTFRITSSTTGGVGSHVYMDKLGRELKNSTQSMDGRYLHTVRRYNGWGRNHQVSEPFLDGDSILFNTVKHDALGRVIESIDYDNTKNTIRYEGLTRISTNDVGGKHQEKTEIRNAMDQLVEVTDNIGNSVTYEYDSFGNLTSVIDSNLAETTSISYDALGRKISMNDLDKGLWRYTYNGLGEMITQTDAEGNTSCVVYDLLGRMTRRYDSYLGTVSRSLGEALNAKNDCTSPGTDLRNDWVYDTASGKSKGKLHRVESSDGSYRRTHHYDSTYGRLDYTIEILNGVSYRTDMDYDSLHRANILTYPGIEDRLQLESVYNNLGFQIQLRDAEDTSKVFQSIVKADAQGNVTEEFLGNGVKTQRAFDPVTNRITDIKTWLPTDWAAPSIQELHFEFDVIGNLELREDYIQNISETFQYDDLNRLYDAHADFGNGDDRVTQVRYDDLGNIKSKTGVGSYTYGATCNGVVAGPHAVTNITAPKSTSYCYDRNGNMTHGDGRTIQYSTFGKPVFIQKGSSSTSIAYSPDRTRFKRVDESSAGSTTYHYVGGLFERVTLPSGEIEERSFIGGVAIRTLTKKANNELKFTTRYLHKDHIGSLTVITDSIGRIVEEFSFDPWGKRRAPNLNKLELMLGDWSDLTSDQKSNLLISASDLSSRVTNRGFTGHEQLDEVGLIHMNGRVYDAGIGRFISADPFVQDTSNQQALNRYSYVQNNPLSYTDPSGYFLKNIFNKFVKQLRHNRDVLRSFGRHFSEVIDAVPGLSTVVGLVIGVYCPPCSAAYFQYLSVLEAIIAYDNGVPLGAVLTNAAVGMATAGVGGALGREIGGGLFGAAAGSMLASGIAAKAAGGKFIDGMKSGAKGFAVGMAATYVGNKLAAKLARVGESTATNGAQKGDGFFKGLWKKATAWHFEKRHAANGPLLSLDVAEEQGFYGGVPADFHQDGVGSDELKLVHADGREMIYDGDTNQPIGMERAGIMGTYNYVSMPERPAAGAGIWANVKFGASFVVRGIGHGVADVLPYKVLGGNVRGSECAVNNCAP